jgi:hypothetical protein
VDNTARDDEEIVSRLDLDALAGDRPTDDTLRTIDRFFPVTNRPAITPDLWRFSLQ